MRWGWLILTRLFSCEAYYKLVGMRIFIFAALFLLSPVAIAQEADFSNPIQTEASPVLVELFSSQNCPACPPADAYMRVLSQSDGVIALSCHVDYFGGTKTHLEKKFCTNRQTRYIEQIGRKSHFTPQIMVNGHMSEIGYEEEKVSAAIVKARSERVEKIDIESKGKGVYNFTLAAQNLPKTAELWVAVYSQPVSFQGRGRTMVYYNTVSNLMKLGEWKGAAINRPVYPFIMPSSAGFAVFAQDIETGKVLAAGDYKL